MDIGDIAGLLALLVSAGGLFQNILSTRNVNATLKDIRRERDKEAKRVDKLIDNLIGLSGGTK